MINPIKDLYKYTLMFQSYLGKTIYVIFALGFFAAVFEGFGILMMLPLLESLDGNSLPQAEGTINLIFLKIISLSGLENSTSTILLVITFAFIVKGILAFGALAVKSVLSGKLLRRFKGNLFDHYSEMTFDYYSTKDTGHFTNLINDQATRSLTAFDMLATLGGQFINTLVLISLAFAITWQFGIMISFVGIFLLFIFMILNKYVRELSRNTAFENGILTKWLIQTLQGYKYLSSTGQTHILKKRIINSISKLTNNQVGQAIASSFTQSVREPITVVLIMMVVFIQLMIFDQKLAPILVSIVLFYRALNSVIAVQAAFQGTFMFIGSMEAVDNEFKNQKNNKIINGTKLLEDFHHGIELKNVSFRYNKRGEYQIRNVSFLCPALKSIALVGISGAGKSTIADMITLLKTSYEGEILIDNIEAKNIDRKSWQNQIGYVSQETVIFNDTIANNISMWSEIDNLSEELETSAARANILDFINSLENGFETIVGDRGVLLSGGQKQRIFIARELFRKPKVLILDEATSSLDSESEKEIQKSIESLKGEITLILIAHRLSTLKNVDFINVLDDGKILESGTYEELMGNKNSKFRKLAALQTL